MEKVPIHEHPLLPFTRFDRNCFGCKSESFIYGGYRCNELGCRVVFHKECAESLPEINHSSHPDHPLKLLGSRGQCSRCTLTFNIGYSCSTCKYFQLDLDCARRQAPVLFPEANHTSHPQHPLKLLDDERPPDYADKRCLLCGFVFYHRLYHCDVCNFSICKECMSNPPPLVVVSMTTHEHQLHLLPRRIEFTCNACGTQGNQSPYFCHQCNFMIHWECIDLPRIININRHDHRVSYTPRLGHGKWKCGVCRKKVDGFYGAYFCSKCPSFAVHSRCATRKDVWDKVELEGTPEEKEIPPFEEVNDNTIKHFSHDHNLRLNKDCRILSENIVCEACVFQICSEPFYSCEQCDFIIHKKCANLPREKRHVSHNLPFTLHTDSHHESFSCSLCFNYFTGFRYESSDGTILDVRCGSVSEPFEHKSHLTVFVQIQNPLYYAMDNNSECCACGKRRQCFSCDNCEDFRLCFKCAMLPQKVMRHRYDDHPLFLSYGEKRKYCCEADDHPLFLSYGEKREYWCEACETKVNPEKWFYTCNDCGITLHISCVVGDFSYTKQGSVVSSWEASGKVVPNTSICRQLCTVCDSRCKLPSILKLTKAGVDVYICSLKCIYKMYDDARLLSWKNLSCKHLKES